MRKDLKKKLLLLWDIIGYSATIFLLILLSLLYLKGLLGFDPFNLF